MAFSVSTNTSEAIEFPTTLPVMESFPRHSILPMIVPMTSSEQSEIMLPLMVVPFVIRVVPSCCRRQCGCDGRREARGFI